MNKSKERFEGFSVFTDAKGYKCIWVDGKTVKIHVFIWERKNGKKPEGFDIHHLNHDKGDYTLSNLELMSKSDHSRLHAGWVRTGEEWTHKPCTGCGELLRLVDFYPRKGKTPSANCKQCHMELTKSWAKKNPQRRKEISLDYYYRKKSGR